MYHYTAWADHGMTDPLSLVVFHRQVMRATAQSTGKYTLVHCRYIIICEVCSYAGVKAQELNIKAYYRIRRAQKGNDGLLGVTSKIPMNISF